MSSKLQAQIADQRRKKKKNDFDYTAQSIKEFFSIVFRCNLINLEKILYISSIMAQYIKNRKINNFGIV